MPADTTGTAAADWLTTQRRRAAAEHLLMNLKTHGDKVLYVWDYFFLARMPAKGDEVTWRTIERATLRLRTSEADAHVSRPPDIRLKAARRMRSASRLALRHIDRLSERPEQWVIDALVDIEAVADELTKALSEPAARIVVH